MILVTWWEVEVSIEIEGQGQADARPNPPAQLAPGVDTVKEASHLAALMTEFAAPEPEPAPATYAVLPGRFYAFEQDLAGYWSLLERLQDDLDAVTAGGFHQGAARTSHLLLAEATTEHVRASLLERWGARGRQELDPGQLSALMAWLADYVDVVRAGL
jgi:hypothetical protein